MSASMGTACAILLLKLRMPTVHLSWRYLQARKWRANRKRYPTSTGRYGAQRCGPTAIPSIHSFPTAAIKEPFMPGYESMSMPAKNAGILRVDHIVGNVELGKMNAWAEWYSHVLGFYRYMTFDDKDISTEYSALMSIVMANDSSAIKMPINEPAPGRRKSQIQEYLDFYHGPGVQHYSAVDGRHRQIGRQNEIKRRFIFKDARQLLMKALRRGWEKSKKISRIFADLGILADRDEEGYLLQIFTEPVADRPYPFLRNYSAQRQPGIRERKF